MNENEITKLIKDNWNQKPSAYLKGRIIGRIQEEEKQSARLNVIRKLRFAFVSICVFITAYAYITDRIQSNSLTNVNPQPTYQAHLNYQQMMAMLDEDFNYNKNLKGTN